MRWLFFVRDCEAVNLPLKQIINDEKALKDKSKENCLQKNKPA